MVRRTCRLALLLPLLLLLTAASAPNRYEKLVADLGSADPDVRVAARTALMDLNVRQLPALADAAEALPRLDYNQREALRIIVDHVAIASEASTHRGMGGFLGVQFQPDALAFGGFEDAFEGDGVLIRSTHIGFPAFQHLRPGDVIIGIGHHRPDSIRTGDDLIGSLMAFDGGDFVTLHVRRGLEVKKVTLRLASNFLRLGQMGLDAPSLNQVQNWGLAEADAIWADHFARLFPAEEVADAR